MSNHKDSLVKVLEYLVNDEREKASDLLHNIFVEKAKSQWAALTENDEIVEDDIQDDDLDETIDLDLEEEIDNYDAEDDFLNDIESAEDEIDNEEIYDSEDMSDDEAETELAFDMSDDQNDDNDAENALANVEDAIAELRAVFADLMGSSGEGMDMEDDEGMDMEDDEDTDMEDEVDGFKESVDLKSVNAKMPDGSDNGAKSPVGKGGKGATDAKPHPTDVKVENGGKTPSAKAMSVTGPESGAKLSTAPKAKIENTKSVSPIRGMK